MVHQSYVSDSRYTMPFITKIVDGEAAQSTAYQCEVTSARYCLLIHLVSVMCCSIFVFKMEIFLNHLFSSVSSLKVCISTCFFVVFFLYTISLFLSYIHLYWVSSWLPFVGFYLLVINKFAFLWHLVMNSMHSMISNYEQLFENLPRTAAL